ncbi:MAG: Sec-independent protein translocase protein TatB [Pseudomonas sp.]
MFDIGFSELLLIAVVALVVLGPERLPKAARFAGLWVRRARQQWESVKQELERELEAEELKRSLHSVQDSLREAEQQLRESRQRLQDETQALHEEVRRDVDIRGADSGSDEAGAVGPALADPTVQPALPPPGTQEKPH